MMTATTTYQCGCGKITGMACEQTGPAAEMVVVEYMPDQHKASHTAAGNSGSYPHNGSRRVACCRECAALAVEGDAEWTTIVTRADVSQYAEPVESAETV